LVLAADKRLYILAKKAAVPPGRAINAKIAAIGPLPECGVTYIQETAGVAQRHPLSLVGEVQIYQDGLYKPIKICKKLVKNHIARPD